jgi:predicted DsbA family dithiol-disulfide isomerase
MQIDVVSDTVCPWCHIGRARLNKAIALRPDLDIQVVWHPFQLAPELPPEGVDRKEYLEQKFGGADKARHIYTPIVEAGAYEGIPFAFEKIQRSPNTFDSHRLILWAGAAGCQDRMVGILFRLYFEDGADIGDREVLAGAAAEAGMDADLVRELLAGDADRDRIEAELMVARRLNIQGVPTFLFNQRYLLSGAQDPMQLSALFDRIEAEGQNPAPPAPPAS